MLKLAEDLKATIRKEGIDGSKARELDKLSAERLNVDEKKALKIRVTATRQVIEEKYSLAQTRSLVNKLLAQNNPEKTRSKQTAKIDKFVKNIRSVKIEKIEPSALAILKQVLQEKLQEIDKSLGVKKD
jgi:ParB family transcriptional regulator, chromosome partitioning protein